MIASVAPTIPAGIGRGRAGVRHRATSARRRGCLPPRSTGGRPTATRIAAMNRTRPSDRREVDLPAEQVVEAAAEDRVGRGEQDGEDHRQRHAEEQAAGHGGHRVRRSGGGAVGVAGPSLAARAVLAPRRLDDARRAGHDGLEGPGGHRRDGRGGSARDGQPGERRDRRAEEQRAPSVSSSARNGSARTATNAARTSAVTGSQASSGSGARSRRRSSQPAARVATTRIAMLMPNAGPSRTTSASRPEGEGADEQTAGDGSVQGVVLRCGRRGQARVGGQGWGRLGRTVVWRRPVRCRRRRPDRTASAAPASGTMPR